MYKYNIKKPTRYLNWLEMSTFTLILKLAMDLDQKKAIFWPRGSSTQFLKPVFKTVQKRGKKTQQSLAQNLSLRKAATQFWVLIQICAEATQCLKRKLKYQRQQQRVHNQSVGLYRVHLMAATSTNKGWRADPELSQCYFPCKKHLHQCQKDSRVYFNILKEK